jgi:general secretion pathway protein A
VSNPAGPPIDPSPAEKFFGLAARPFSLTPDLRFAYHSRSHTHALEQVTSALRRREGLIVVTGAIGTGKTMLCRSMLEGFESRTFLSVILDPGLEVEDLLRQVLTDFGIIGSVDASDPGPMSEVTRHQFVSTLQQFLASLIPLQAHAVIMIDEAQRLNPRVLEEIRLLSNFETDEAKLLQIVLVGQPDLDEMLQHPKMRQLNQRVARRCELHPLSESEVGDYIERRLTVAGSPAVLPGGVEGGPPETTTVVRFSPAAVKAVAGISGGIPRLVNTLCDRALEAAYERQVRIVDPDSVIAAAERLRLEIPGGISLPGARPRTWLIAAAGVLLAIVAGTTWWLARPASAPGSDAVTPPSRSAPRIDAAPAPGSSASSSTPSPDAAAASPAPDRSVPATGSAQTPAPASGSTASAVGGSQAQAAAAAGAFQIAVAAFKTEARARDVATAVAAVQVPATVRLDSTGSWYRVMAGPFATRETAQAAQTALERAGYDGTRISQISSDAR